MSSDSESDFTPIHTPAEGSIHTPSASVSDLSQSTPSIVEHTAETPTHDSSALSTRSSSVSSHGSESSWDNSDAEAEWRESIQQLELLLSMIIIPFFGKWVGRKCAYWGTSYGRLGSWSLVKLTQWYDTAWAKFMTWKHPGLDVVVTSKATYNIAGAIGALSVPSAPL